MSAMTSAVLEMFGKTSTSLAIPADFTMSLRHYSLKNGGISFFICTFALIFHKTLDINRKEWKEESLY